MSDFVDKLGTSALLSPLLDQVPFGVAALEFDGQRNEFIYAYANARYERLARGSSIVGSTFAEVWPQAESGNERLRRVLETGDQWWTRYLPGGGDLHADSRRMLPFVRVLSRFAVEDRHYVVDFIVDTESSIVESAVEAAKSAAGLGSQVESTPAPDDVSLLARVAAMSSSSLTLQKVCERTLSAMRDHITDLVSAGVYVLNDEGTSLRALARYSRGQGLEAEGDPVPVSPTSDAGMLVLQGYQLLTHESGGDGRRRRPIEDIAPAEFRWIDLAIERRGKVLGVLELGFEGSGSFEQDEIRLYHGIAAVLGNAVGNARSYAAEVRAARIAEGVGLILSASMRATSEDELRRECLSVLESLTESELGFLSDFQSGRLTNVAVSDAALAAAEMGSDPLQVFSRGLPLSGVFAAAVEMRETLVANDLASHPDHVGTPLGHPPVRSLMATPLLGKRGQVFGLIGLSNRPGGYGEDERQAVEALAPAIVEAIERYRAERQLADNARFADELNHIESIIHATLDFDTIAQEALRTGMEALGANSAALSLHEPPHFRVTNVAGLDQDMVDHRIPEELEPHSLLAIRTKAPVLIQDVASDERVNTTHLISYGIRAVMAIPLLFGGNAFGIAYYNFSQPREYSEAEVRFVVRLSLSLSLAMENARLYETERTVSNRLQEALLALPDVVPGVEFAHAYYPATDAARVGGDFYDIFELSYDHVGITIGDVAGKGVDAAALTSLVKNSIRAHAAERGKTPAQVLRLTNEVLYKTTPVESFVTVFFGILDCRDGRLVCANGGHTTAAMVRPSEVVKLPVTGPLLGALPEIELDHAEARLGPDDSLFLYTDGLTEARRGKELYGEERLFRSLAEAQERVPRKLMHKVVADMMAFSHGQLRDDLAILVARRVAGGLDTPYQQKLDV